MTTRIPQRIAAAVELLAIQPHDYLLEIGCGNGADAALVCEQLGDGRLVAIDRSEKQISQASQRNHAQLQLGKLTLQVGFVIDHDTRVSDEIDIVQLTPPGSACSIVVGSGIVDMPPGSVQGLQLVVSNIEAARAELVERGVKVSAIQHYEGAVLVNGRGGDWNSFIFFSDPDGNGWVVQEIPARD